MATFTADMSAEDLALLFRDMITEHWSGERLEDACEELETLLDSGD